MPSTNLPRPAPARVIAVGAWLKNAAARIDGTRVRWSSLHGDLSEPTHCEALRRSVEELLSDGDIEAIAHDLHPDFFSTRLAQSMGHKLGIPTIPIQHHHAHIAAVQAEYGATDPVIGLALDGVGLGTDGTAWGGELLWVRGPEWRRLGHLRQLRLPGGDVAAREPWRLAAALLQQFGRGNEIEMRFPMLVPPSRSAVFRSMLDRGVNCPVTSSAGRWFDAAAAVLNVCLLQDQEAKAAMALEEKAHEWLGTNSVVPDQTLVPILADGRLDLHPLFEFLFSLADARAVAEGAAIFHVNLADGLARWAGHAAQAHRIDAVALGGGCFFNRILRERVEVSLRGMGLRVLRPMMVSCGDAGLALGQAWAAAHALGHQPGGRLISPEVASCV